MKLFHPLSSSKLIPPSHRICSRANQNSRSCVTNYNNLWKRGFFWCIYGVYLWVTLKCKEAIRWVSQILILLSRGFGKFKNNNACFDFHMTKRKFRSELYFLTRRFKTSIFVAITLIVYSRKLCISSYRISRNLTLHKIN